MSAELGVPLATVCRLTDAPRSTVYARRSVDQQPTERLKRGPKTAPSDDELTGKIKEVIRTAPFAGEGHRKVTARLRRDHAIRVGRKRVLRLIGHQSLQFPCKPDRPLAESRFDQAGQPGVVDEVDNGQHRP